MQPLSKYPTLPVCALYHSQSDLRDRPGYYPNISSSQLDAANELINHIEKERLQFNIDEEVEFLKLLRFLRARKFNVSQALHMIRDDIAWRQHENRMNLRHETAVEVLGCDVAKLYTYFPTWIQGTDKQLRPVSYRQFGKFEVWNVLKLTTMDQLVRFHAWETEVALHRMYSCSKRSGCNIETFVVVIDAAGWGLRLATSDAFSFIKGMATTDSNHYPERLGTLVVINAPNVLAVAYRVIQGLLDDVQKRKIRILGTNKNEWFPILAELIDVDQIPQQYGGLAPDLSAEEALSSMNLASDIVDEYVEIKKVSMSEIAVQTDDDCCFELCMESSDVPAQTCSVS
jgi:hypothetical protein